MISINIQIKLNEDIILQAQFSDYKEKKSHD